MSMVFSLHSQEHCTVVFACSNNWTICVYKNTKRIPIFYTSNIIKASSKDASLAIHKIIYYWGNILFLTLPVGPDSRSKLIRSIRKTFRSRIIFLAINGCLCIQLLKLIKYRRIFTINIRHPGFINGGQTGYRIENSCLMRLSLYSPNFMSSCLFFLGHQHSIVLRNVRKIAASFLGINLAFW